MFYLFFLGRDSGNPDDGHGVSLQCTTSAGRSSPTTGTSSQSSPGDESQEQCHPQECYSCRSRPVWQWGINSPQEPRTQSLFCPLDDTSECQSLSPVWLYLSVSVISKDGTYSLLNRKVGFKLHFITVELTLRCITFYSTTVLVLGLSAVCSSHGIFGDHWPTDEWNEKASRYYWSGLWSN